MVTMQLPAPRGFDSEEQEAFLRLWRAYDRLRALEDAVFSEFELTAQQYNLLRLLNADHPEPASATSLVTRMVSRAPDVSRMLDRLEERWLIQRVRQQDDRRAIRVSITPLGTELLERIAEPIRTCHRHQLGHLTKAELSALIALLHRVSEPHEPDGSPWK